LRLAVEAHEHAFAQQAAAIGDDEPLGLGTLDDTDENWVEQLHSAIALGQTFAMSSWRTP
jgi:hypothetical protein